jgi:hypothetical protein
MPRHNNLPVFSCTFNVKFYWYLLTFSIPNTILYLMVNEGLLSIPEESEKLIISLRTAYAKELTLDKEQPSYSIV